MAEYCKNPRIRFKGFTEEWEQRKVNDLTNRFDNLRVPVTASLRISGNTPYYGANGIQDYVSGYTHKGEFILIAEDGANDLKNYPVQYVNGEIWVNNHAHVLQSKEKISDNKFLKYSISNSNIESVLVGGGRAKLNADVLMNIDLSVPKYSEQKELGEFFTDLDNLITLHQRKCEKLKNAKKAFLEKMFPKNDENTPEIRFKGFTEEWEQRKFNYFFEERNERSGDGELISVTINSGIKKFSELNRFDTKPEDMSKYKVVKENDIAYNSMRMWQGASGLSPYNGILSPAYTVITPKANVSSLFFSYQIKKPQMIHLFEINSQGLTKDTWNLKFAPFSQIDTSAPKSFDEQQKIGSLFKDLDNLITLHQRKCEKLKNVKKALLEKMFV